jgi:hypothetical protein
MQNAEMPRVGTSRHFACWAVQKPSGAWAPVVNDFLQKGPSVQSHQFGEFSLEVQQSDAGSMQFLAEG